MQCIVMAPVCVCLWAYVPARSVCVAYKRFFIIIKLLMCFSIDALHHNRQKTGWRKVVCGLLHWDRQGVSQISQVTITRFGLLNNIFLKLVKQNFLYFGLPTKSNKAPTGCRISYVINISHYRNLIIIII